MNYDKKVEMGERMGLLGTELLEFVNKKEKQYTECEERMQRRDEDRCRFEAQEAEKFRHYDLPYDQSATLLLNLDPSIHANLDQYRETLFHCRTNGGFQAISPEISSFGEYFPTPRKKRTVRERMSPRIIYKRSELHNIGQLPSAQKRPNPMIIKRLKEFRLIQYRGTRGGKNQIRRAWDTNNGFCESHLKEQTLRSQEIIEDKTSQSIAEILRAKEDAEKNKPKDPNASGAGIAIEQEHHQDVPVQHQATPLEEVLQENALILNDIAETCAQKKIKHTDNILLLGNAGSGKSALLNTIIKALSGRYIPRARYGFGQTCALTKTLQRFENCGITEDDIADADRRDILKHAIPYLPSFFDSPPFCNSSPEMMEILELVIGGFIPPNTSFISLERLQQGNYPGFLKDKFAQSNPNWRISKIVFVQSPRDSLDERLIKMVNGLLTVEDQERCCPIYSIDNFVVITKYDLVDSGDTVKFRQTEGSSFDGLTLEHFERVEHDICSKFNIIEAKEHNMFRWVSYCDTTGYDNPYIDNIALKFIQRMLEKDSQPFKPCHIPKLAIRRWFKIKVRNLVWRCRYNWIGMGLDLMQKIFGLCIYHALVGINSISRI
ncbi:uncharacterized protein LOC123538735 [Mercenaria mercenaria]|uniref:uncharacterized protein LOC123538735 n=1 Tax=Mercenaria mercenaria TaxID=6596 RepID=UPI00234F8E25|nr:uncharacterized protein LOC123538735 [Mercenaria mercenaria]